ncbi:RNA ligase 1 family protein [Streptomyces sp. NPDC055055]
MKKIPTLFLRDEDDRQHVTSELNPACAWVAAGEGVATVKWDGTCVMLDGDGPLGTWWARREVKPGKPTPADFREVDHDQVTGKRVGWEPMANSPFKRFHAEALRASLLARGTPGTYELVGPKIQGNPSGFQEHLLMPHGWAPFSVRQDAQRAPRDFDQLREWLHARDHEGLVWHHEDGRMAKIKAKDFPRVGDQEVRA